MNEADDNPWDDAPSGDAAPLDSEATPTVILGGGGPAHEGAATEIVSGSQMPSAASQPAPQPPEYAPTTANPVVESAATGSSPFPSGGGGGSGGGPFEATAPEGGSDSMMTLLMAVALVGMLLIIFLLWFKRCDTSDVDRLLDVGLTPLTVQLDVVTNLIGGR